MQTSTHCVMRRILAATALFLIAALVAGCSTSANSMAIKRPTPNTPMPDTSTVARVVATIELGKPPALASSTNGVWFLDVDAHVLDEIDPASNRIVAAIPAPLSATDFIASADSLWVLNRETSSIERLDPHSGQVLATIALPHSQKKFQGARFAITADAIWVAPNPTDAVMRISMATNRIIATIPVDRDPTSLVAGDGAVWVCNHHHAQTQFAGLWRIDPRTNQVVARININDTTQNIAYKCGGVTLGGGAVWVIAVQEEQDDITNLLRIDPATNSVASRISVDQVDFGPAADGASVWMANPDHGTIERFDMRTATLVGTRMLSATFSNESYGIITVAAGGVWVQSFDTGQDGPGSVVWRLAPPS
jgi:streptogramin lyase